MAASDVILRARFEYALGGDAQIEVIRESGGDKLLQGIVLKQVEPFRISDGVPARGKRLIPELIRNGDLWPVVVGSDSASGEKQGARNYEQPARPQSANSGSLVSVGVGRRRRLRSTRLSIT